MRIRSCRLNTKAEKTETRSDKRAFFEILY
nr:MAG TPA: hypothetical protein [Caudoviricetes sp.]